MAIKFTPWEDHARYCMNFLYKEGLLQDLERDWVERRINQRLKENPNYGILPSRNKNIDRCKYWNDSPDYIAYPCGDNDCPIHKETTNDES